ncbi:MAG: winged helix-turn-helix transcriptional regulator [Bacteroidota bacterium]
MHTREVNKNDQIKQQIIELLKEKGNLAFGDLIQELSLPYEAVLKNVLELKRQGLIEKRQENGHFALL